jgi:hypothetical protein
MEGENMFFKKSFIPTFIWITTFFVFSLTFSISCFAKVYHIDPLDGNSRNDGTSASPLKSWFDLPTMNKGDDVFFKCGTTYYPSVGLTINWEGSSSDPVEIGAYYLEGSRAIYGVKGSRPIISGNGHKVPENQCFGYKNSWQGLLQVYSKDFIHIKDLHIYQSGNRGILISGNLENLTNAENFLIKNTKIEDSFGPGIIIEKNANNYGIIEGCEVMGSGYSWKSGCNNDWPVALAVFSSPYSNTTIKRNYVHENWGEGIGSGRVDCNFNSGNSGFVIIEDNIVWANRRVDIYISRTEHNIVRGNILVGNQDSTFSNIYSDQRSWHQYGIWVNVENRGDCANSNNNNFIYNNYVAGHYAGIGLSSAYPDGNMENIYFFNNTSIANRQNYSIGGLENYNTRNLLFKNNVSYCPAGTICKDVGLDQEWISKKVIADYNAWEKQPVFWKGENDQETDNLWSKTDGWQKLESIPKKNEFYPVSGNVCIGKGEPLDFIEIPSYPMFNQVKKDISTISNWNIGADPKFGQVSDTNDMIPAPKLQIK